MTADRSLTGSDALVDSLLMVESVPAVVILNLMEGGSDSVEETAREGLAHAYHIESGRATYVLMIAKMKVPQGRLQDSSRLAVAPVTSEVPLFCTRFRP